MQRYIIAAIDDLFFASKIRATAEPLNVEVKFVRNLDGALAAAKEHRPDLIIVNLQAEFALPLAQAFKSETELEAVPLLGFYSHVMTEQQQLAKQAGFTTVVPRSLFASRLADILTGNFKK